MKTLSPPAKFAVLVAVLIIASMVALVGKSCQSQQPTDSWSQNFSRSSKLVALEESVSRKLASFDARKAKGEDTFDSEIEVLSKAIDEARTYGESELFDTLRKLRAVARARRPITHARRRYDQAFRSMGLWGDVSREDVASVEKLRSKLVVLDEVLDAVNELDRVSLAFNDKLAEEIRNEGIVEASGQRIVNDYQELLRLRRQTERDAVAVSKDFIKFLIDRWGTWRLNDTGGLVFQLDADDKASKELLGKLDALARKIEQIVSRMDAQRPVQ